MRRTTVSEKRLELIGFVPTTDIDRAISFFRDVLECDFVSRDEFAAVFDSVGQSIRVVAVETFDPQPFTILGWRTLDIRATVTRRTERGLTFLRYPHFKQDELGIWSSPSGAKVAWFNDPDGNVLSYTEHRSDWRLA